MPLADTAEATALNTIFNTTLYLRLLQGSTAGLRPNGDGTLPAGLTEVSTGGYTPRQITSAYWNSAVGGSPTIKTMPNAPHSPVTFTPSGAAWDLVAFAFTSDTSTISATNYVGGDCFVDVHNSPLVYHVGNGVPFDITNIYPIVVRLGDPPAGVNPT